jgi:3D (Asp-Asp-Asp) domain-containing protein
MTLITLPLHSEIVIPLGTCVVLHNAGSPEVRAFSIETDTVEDIIGVVYPTAYASGRAGPTDGPIHYTNSVFQFEESLRFVIQNGTYVYNPTYDPQITPTDTSKFATIQTNGLAAVLKTSTHIPVQWVKITTGEEYDLFIVCL